MLKRKENLAYIYIKKPNTESSTVWEETRQIYLIDIMQDIFPELQS